MTAAVEDEGRVADEDTLRKVAREPEANRSY